MLVCVCWLVLDIGFYLRWRTRAWHSRNQLSSDLLCYLGELCSIFALHPRSDHPFEAPAMKLQIANYEKRISRSLGALPLLLAHLNSNEMEPARIHRIHCDASEPAH